MSYPKLKTREGTVTITPELLREIARQLPVQMKDMSLREIIALGVAFKELAYSTTVSRMDKLVKGH